MKKKSNIMNKDQNYCPAWTWASVDDEIPSFEEALKEWKKKIAQCRKEGDHESADALAKCCKGNRCLSFSCPICNRRRQIAFKRYPELAIRDDLELDELRIDLLQLSVDAIKVVGPRRPIDQKKLAVLKASIKLVGLQTPISVRKEKNKFFLVTGWHRLTAVKELGATTISCIYYERYLSDRDLYLWERAENAARVELRVLEEAERINEMRQAILQEGGQHAPPGGHQPNSAGIKRAAKILGYTKEKVRRSMRIAERVSPEAKADARKLGLDDNQDALLQIAKLPAGAQCAAVSAIAQAHIAARARLVSSAVAVANEKTVTKIQGIEEQIAKKETEIAKKKEQLQALKREVTDERDGLDKACRDLAATYVNNSLIGGPMAVSENSHIVTVRGGRMGTHDQPFTLNEKKILDAIVAAWNEAGELQRLVAAAPFAVRDHFIHEYMQKAHAAEGYSKTDLDVSKPAQG
jgi:hypothetical protein